MEYTSLDADGHPTATSDSNRPAAEADVSPDPLEDQPAPGMGAVVCSLSWLIAEARSGEAVHRHMAG